MIEKIEELFVGQKVKISKSAGWRDNFAGKIAYPPKISFFDEFNGNFFRKLKIGKREITFVWIIFDIPQIDADGDGKYSQAEINIKYLQLLKN